MSAEITSWEMPKRSNLFRVRPRTRKHTLFSFPSQLTKRSRSFQDFGDKDFVALTDPLTQMFHKRKCKYTVFPRYQVSLNP